MYSDRRVPGRERWCISEPNFMQLPDDIRKCVAYIGYSNSTGIYKLAGTVFFLAKPSSRPNLNFTYAVTAAHVILGIVKNGGRVAIRLNLRSGGHRWVETGAWAVHRNFDTDNVDVSFSSFPLDTFDKGGVDHTAYPLAGLAGSETLRKNAVGIGDEIFLTGLFYPHSGTSRNIPIVR